MNEYKNVLKYQPTLTCIIENSRIKNERRNKTIKNKKI